MIKNVAVLTGGGDCPGLNAVIRGIVKSGIVHYDWNMYGIKDGFDGLIDNMHIEPMTLNDIRGILPKGGTILGTSNRGNPFHYPVKTESGTEYRDVSDKILKSILKHRIDGMVVIGGDGTLNIANELYKKGANIVGVPKTIDNDINATDYTFGFQTAVNTATEAIDKLHTTAESHHRIMIVEVMGRDTGWISLSAGIAGGADIILIPEIPFCMESIISKIESRKNNGSAFSIIVCAEGAHEKGEDIVKKKQESENGGLPLLGGIGRSVEEKLSERTDFVIRTTVLGHLQRGGQTSPYDRILSSRFGVEAANLIAQKKFGNMVSLRGRDIVSVPLQEAIGEKNYVDPNGQLVETARRLSISLGD
ncbi:MAG: ATP-dependent 6-phosphofructokinase [bacterium]